MSPENNETPSETPTIAEIADACREVLDEDSCDEIAANDDLEDAISEAYAKLIEAGIDEPADFLREKGIIAEM